MASSTRPPAEAAAFGEDDDASEAIARVGAYTWADFLREHDLEAAVEPLYEAVEEHGRPGLIDRVAGARARPAVPSGADWEAVAVDPETWLGFHPDDTPRRLRRAATRTARVLAAYKRWIEATPVAKDAYTWEHFKWEYYYQEDGRRPRDEDGDVVPFDPTTYLGFRPANLEAVLTETVALGHRMLALEDQRTVNVDPELDEDAFFSTPDGHTTLVNRYDLEKAVAMAQKPHFTEVERYWVNEPYAFVIVFHSAKENEEKYYLVTPYLNEIEDQLVTFIAGKLRTAIRYSDEGIVVDGSDAEREAVLQREILRLLDRYDLRVDDGTAIEGLRSFVASLVGAGDASDAPSAPTAPFEGIEARPEPAVIAEDPETLTEYQVEKLLHLLTRDFVGYERIDGIKHDINVEDISCDGYNEPVFVYHTEYENIITNVGHGEAQLDNFVVKLAQRSGKGISKRTPQVDATLPDGSRAQLTLGREVSDHGTNYTIRQFNDVPFTPIDLVNWNTFSLEEMAFLWLCIEHNKSLIFAGGTASGKTTTLNAASLFIPSNTKIVSIEDTREVELPQRNWIASVTRPSFTADDSGDIDEFDLLEAALRQRPDYIAMGEVRGEEGRSLFQVMSTGHTTLTTFHADSVGEVLKRFTTDPINVSKTMFTAVDLVSVQTQTRVQGRKVRRNKAITEVNHYDAENDEINVQDLYRWQPERDEHLPQGLPNTLQEIAFDQGWSQERLEEELAKRKAVLAYLIEHGLTAYAQVAATLQAFINDPDTILALMARGQLERSLEDLREMESVVIDVQPEKEALVPRPTPSEETRRLVRSVLEEAQERFLEAYRSVEPSPLVQSLSAVTEATDVIAVPGAGEALRLTDGDTQPRRDADPVTNGGHGADRAAGGEESDAPTDDRGSRDDGPTGRDGGDTDGLTDDD